jgi:hypothetical protein
VHSRKIIGGKAKSLFLFESDLIRRMAMGTESAITEFMPILSALINCFRRVISHKIFSVPYREKSMGLSGKRYRWTRNPIFDN